MAKKMVETLRAVKRRVQTVGKPLAIHCEAQHMALARKALIEYLNNNRSKPTLFCITPENSAYVKGFFEQPLLNKKQFARALKKAYLNLQGMGHDIQLHVHLSRVPNQFQVGKKRWMIHGAYNWMKHIGLKPTELVLGWFAEEEGVPEIARSLNLRLVKMSDYKTIHDYNLIL